jgi:hypothetical protein
MERGTGSPTYWLLVMNMRPVTRFVTFRPSACSKQDDYFRSLRQFNGQASKSWTLQPIDVAAADLTNACSACIGQFFTPHAPLLYMLQVHLADT